MTKKVLFFYVKYFRGLNSKIFSTLEKAPFIENLWLVDGTGSYRSQATEAKKQFKENRAKLMEMNNPTAKLGIAFISGKFGSFTLSIDQQFSSL